MGVPDSSLNDLERQRIQLEGNVRKLQESLYHWRTWEAEYDGLKEEIGSLSEDAAAEDFLQIGRDFGGSLATEDEIKVLLGGKQGAVRTRTQVVGLIAKRIGYVKQNAAIMEKRLQTAENQLGALDAIERLPTESGSEYPMLDIMEELDDNGKVLSSSVNTPGDHAPELLEVLKKAGVKDIPDVRRKVEETTEDRVTEIKDEEEGPAAEGKDEQKSDTRNEIPTPAPLERDGVPQANRASHAPEPMKQASEDNEERPVTDVDESPEDARLRREMLEYGLSEVGSVVAELELDDNGSDVSLDDGYGSYEYESEEDEEEDEFGRSTRKVLDEDYHHKMRELEAKLNAKGMYNMGKDTDALPVELKQDLERRVAEEPDDKPVSEKKSKKKVAFADDIDVAPSPKQPPPEKKVAAPRQPDVPAISDSIVERTEQADKDTGTAEPPKKASRFKSARRTPQTNTTDEPPQSRTGSTSTNAPEVRSTRKPDAPSNPSSLSLFPATPKEPKPFSQPIPDTTEPTTSPRPPQDKILADNLVERDNARDPAAPPEPGDVDEQLHRKEIATEFYQMRNRMVQRNGGFVDDDEPETVPVETDQAPKRVSKFKAARMG
jgi:unconventional prefoldin RPB5 interactor 1